MAFLSSHNVLCICFIFSTFSPFFIYFPDLLCVILIFFKRFQICFNISQFLLVHPPFSHHFFHSVFFVIIYIFSLTSINFHYAYVPFSLHTSVFFTDRETPRVRNAFYLFGNSSEHVRLLITFYCLKCRSTNRRKKKSIRIGIHQRLRLPFSAGFRRAGECAPVSFNRCRKAGLIIHCSVCLCSE